MHSATLIHITPDADKAVARIARVSNPSNEDNEKTYPKLIRYLIDHNHWSPFETVHATVEVVTTRDIGRQLLRHRSFTFQEFSGRYAAYEEILSKREGRYQDSKNRQNSLEEVDRVSQLRWKEVINEISNLCELRYKELLDLGFAKECARAILPEGLVPTRIYVCGNLRSFIHYCKERLAPGVQKEHRELAQSLYQELFAQVPMIAKALEGYIQ